LKPDYAEAHSNLV